MASSFIRFYLDATLTTGERFHPFHEVVQSAVFLTKQSHQQLRWQERKHKNGFREHQNGRNNPRKQPAIIMKISPKPRISTPFCLSFSYQQKLAAPTNSDANQKF